MSSTEASTPESSNSANRRNIPWNGDGVDGGPSSLEILYEWILKPGNYARWKGVKGDSKEEICQEICLLMAQKGIPHRISRDIRNRITYIEKQYKEAKAYLAEYENNAKEAKSSVTTGQTLGNQPVLGYPSNQPAPNYSAGPSNQPMYGYSSDLAGPSNQSTFNYNNAGPSTSAGPLNQSNTTDPSNDNNSNSAETSIEATLPTQDPMEIASDTQSVASSVDNFDPAESLLAELAEEPEPETVEPEEEDNEEQPRKEIYAALAMKFKTKPVMTLDEMIEIAQAVRTAAESWKSLGYSDAEVMNKVVENWKK